MVFALSKLPDKVAIVGYASTLNQAPFDDPSWAIWSLNTRFDLIPRFDLWFELHDEVRIVWNKSYVEFLKSNQDRVIMAEAIPDVPNPLLYPEKEIFDYFNDNLVESNYKPSEFFCSTFSWMIALAIYLGIKEIGIYGVNLSSDQEYSEAQRASALYFLGCAWGKGIKLDFPQTCLLFKKDKLYWDLK